MIDIVYNKFYDFTRNEITIGGIQTYISDLICVFMEMNYEVCVIQMGNEERSIEINGYTINQYCVKARYKCEALAKRIKSEIDEKNDLVIFATDSIAPLSVRFEKSIAIQHGISWDKPSQTPGSIAKGLLSRMKATYRIAKSLKLIHSVICVDYNFQNWYRTQVDRVESNLVVIPNYSRVSLGKPKPSDVVNIIFARRLFWYRGTRVFVSAIKPVLDSRTNVQITIAGSGDDEQWMREQLSGYSNVKFITYRSEESLDIHQDKHIAVVPTVGSEGTSLSLLEAMSAGCAAIASDVGGMTNIIIDGYNGKLVPAGSVTALRLAIEHLIDDSEKRELLSSRGKETVEAAFSYERWAEQWKTVVHNIMMN